jgi:hypothetical protein
MKRRKEAERKLRCTRKAKKESHPDKENGFLKPIAFWKK